MLSQKVKFVKNNLKIFDKKLVLFIKIAYL